MKINQKRSVFLTLTTLLIWAFTPSLINAATDASALTLKATSIEDNFLFTFTQQVPLNLSTMVINQYQLATELFLYSNGTNGFSFTVETDNTAQGLTEQGYLVKRENGRYVSGGPSTKVKYNARLFYDITKYNNSEAGLKAKLEGDSSPFKEAIIQFGTPLRFNNEVTGPTLAIFDIWISITAPTDQLLAGQYSSVITLTIENL